MIIGRAVIAGLLLALVTGITILSNGLGMVPVKVPTTSTQEKLRAALLAGAVIGFCAGMALAAWLLS